MVPDAATENFGIESSKVQRRTAFENENEFILYTQELTSCGLIFECLAAINLAARDRQHQCIAAALKQHTATRPLVDQTLKSLRLIKVGRKYLRLIAAANDIRSSLSRSALWRGRRQKPFAGLPRPHTGLKKRTPDVSCRTDAAESISVCAQ